jgi:hypothetical protein
MRKKGPTATGTRTLLRRQFEDPLADRQVGVIPSLGPGVLRLLASFPLKFLGVALGIIPVIRAIASTRGFGASPEKIGFELAFFTFELFDFLLQPGDPLQRIAMATFPIGSLLAELEVLSFETLICGAQLSEFLAQSRHQGNQLQGGIAGATDLYQLAIHDQLGVPRMRQKGKALDHVIRNEVNWQTQLRRRFTSDDTEVSCSEDVSVDVTDGLNERPRRWGS